MRETDNPFPALCRRWRQQRHLSQQALAEAAAISQRHLSWLESGRSRPSRSMVQRLAEALDIPLRERNTLLQAAGFAPLYRESSLDEPLMAAVRDALERILEHHQPYPALVMDRNWNWVMGNPAAEQLMALVGVTVDAGPVNIAEATLREDGLLRYIRNRDTALPLFAQRLRSEAVATGNRAMIAQIEHLTRRAGIPGAADPAGGTPLLPVLPLELEFGDLRLSLFTVLSTFGTPQDVTTDELRIESFYPADQTTRAFLEGSEEPR
jgi:transcriptional regulator with XRE-family HTH domain